MNALRSCALGCLFLVLSGPVQAERNAWIATWATSPEPADSDRNEPLSKIDDQTVRERVRLSLGGTQIRIRFSNEYGSSPLRIGAATVAMPNDPSSVGPGSIQTVTFGGHPSTTIPAGAPLLSDPVAFPVTAGAEISISIYFPKRVSTPTLHALALKRAVVSPRGDYTRAEKIESATMSQSSILVSAVLVPGQASQRLVVAFGDSFVDGDGSTVDADNTWPNQLARRLAKTPEGSKAAVVNAGMAGNRLLGDGSSSGFSSFGVSALARFDRDVLALPGLTHVVLLEGLNDIGFPGAKLGKHELATAGEAVTIQDLIDGYLQLISRAHAHGVKLIGATIGPCEEVRFLSGYYSESKEAIRQAINKWIRTSGVFDGVIDIDAVLRDPGHPSRMLPKFLSKDRLHPNDAGYQAMADAVDLNLFK